MSRMLTCLAAGLGFCFCTACTSLFGSILGNDKPSTIPPSVTSGRKRSVFLLVLAVGAALGFQYGVAPWLIENDWTGFISENWLDGCTEYDYNSELMESCVGNQGVYRVGSATFLFFVLAAIGVACKPTFNREVWPAKYVLFLFLCGFTIFIPNEPLFSDIFLNIARIGGAMFIVLQQIIIIDMAYSWNDSWVERSNAAEQEEAGTGRKWLAALLVSAFTMFTLALVFVVTMFVHFTGCQSNNAFIVLTVIMVVLITIAQLGGEEGSLLSSAAVSLYASFLCYTAVAKNPDPSCNPQLGEQDGLSIALGLILTILSMFWTGWSFTAEEKLTSSNKDPDEHVANAKTTTTSGNSTSEQPRVVSGVVTGGGNPEDRLRDGEGDGDAGDDDNNETDPAHNSPTLLSNSWKLNMMLASISCWMAMTLTGWGKISAEGTAANPSVGRVGMWIVIASQWIVLTLYLWSLVAPRLFPGRDFS